MIEIQILKSFFSPFFDSIMYYFTCTLFSVSATITGIANTIRCTTKKVHIIWTTICHFDFFLTKHSSYFQSENTPASWPDHLLLWGVHLSTSWVHLCHICFSVDMKLAFLCRRTPQNETSQVRFPCHNDRYQLST